MKPLEGSLSARRARPLSLLAFALPLLVLPGAALLNTRAAGSPQVLSRPIGPGTRLLRWTDETAPNSFCAVEADLSDPFLRLGVSTGGADSLSLEPLSRQAQRLTRPDRYPIAGVNGDFFFYPNAQQPGIPTSAVIVDGEVVRTPFNRSCLILHPGGGAEIRLLALRAELTLPGGAHRALDGVNGIRGADQLLLYTPRFGASTRTRPDGTEVYLEPQSFPLKYGQPMKARVRAVQKAAGNAPIASGAWVLSGGGSAAAFLNAAAPGDDLELRLDFDPALGPEDQVIGGGPRLVRDGKVSVEREGGSVNGEFATARHPRTAVGFAGKKLFMLVVDGRQPGYSAGMSLPELAQAMVDLGCTDAMNLDGGGSSTLWARGEVINRPSDGRERAVADGLLLFSTAPKGDPVRIAAQPEEIAALPGAEVTLSARAEDRYYNPVPVPADSLRWTVDPRLGAIRDGRFTAVAEAMPDPGTDYRSGDISVTSGAASGTLPVRVYVRPARVEIVPASLRTAVRSRPTFRVRAFDAAGRPLLLPASVRFQASPAVGVVDASGSLATAESPGKGTVTSTIGGVTATAQIEVAEGVAAALDDFEAAGAWKARAVPPTAGTLTVADGPAHSGKHSLKLEYDFTAGSGFRSLSALGTRALGKPFAIKLWVYGDGQGAWLRARLRDGKGAVTMVELARRVDWKDSWKELRAPLSDDLPGPVTLEAIVLTEQDAARRPRGAVYLDDLAVEE